MNEDIPPYNFKALLRKTQFNQMDSAGMINNRRNENLMNENLNHHKITITSKIMKENQRNLEIPNNSKVKKGNPLNNFQSSENFPNNYLETEIEPGLLLSGHLVEI